MEAKYKAKLILEQINNSEITFYLWNGSTSYVQESLKKQALLVVDEVINTLTDLGLEMYNKSGGGSYNERCITFDKRMFYNNVKECIINFNGE
jgi:hypothetical protein